MNSRRIIVFGCILTTLLSVVGVSPAWAYKEGATSAPGSAGAMNMVSIRNDGNDVTYSQSLYNHGVDFRANVCDPTAEWRYRRAGSDSYTKRERSATTCGIWRSYITWSDPGLMKDGSSFCAKQKNNRTRQEYTNNACVDI